MPVATETPVRDASTPPHGPIFVDPTGRRLRRLRTLGVVALGLVVAYVVLLLVAFLGGSTVAAPALPRAADDAVGPTPTAPAAPTARATFMAPTRL